MSPPNKKEMWETVKAIMSCGCPDGDTVMRAAGRINRDEQFCLAVEAILSCNEARENIDTKLRELLIAHDANPWRDYPMAWRPASASSSRARRSRSEEDVATLQHTAEAREAAKTVRAADVIDEMNARALQEVADLLGADRLRSIVEAQVNKIIEKTLLFLLGLRCSFDRLEVDSGRTSPIRIAIEAQVAGFAAKTIEEVTKDGFKSPGLRLEDTRGILRNAYEDTYRKLIKEKIEAWAKTHAQLDVEHAFAQFTAVFGEAK